MHFNSWWYLGLGILSLILLIYTCFKKNWGRCLLLFMIMIGLGYIIEAIIYNFLHSYQYYPKFIKHSSFYDSNLGAIASNAFALPVAATFIATFRKNWFWILAITGIFAGIEWLFLELHIYTHNWWKIGYTALGLPFYFTMAKVLYQKILFPLSGFMHSIILFLITGTLSGDLHIFPIMFFSNRYYEIGWFKNQAQDTTAFAAIFYLSASFFYVWVAKFHWKNKWIKYVLTVFCMFTVNIILQKVGILYSLVWWDPWYYLILSIIVLKTTVAISKRLSIGPADK